ncbi:hypothetical protein [Bradyrhizobium sp.]|uniref:hypothetical protein n=1 Tax=Bradyrhizobium sp. TaxID=376 RepID=UPI0025C3F537|nr:hypothetical protein [Bradyrhizobium sp.]
MRTVAAALLYFPIVFAVGMALGPIRVLWLGSARGAIGPFRNRAGTDLRRPSGGLCRDATFGQSGRHFCPAAELAVTLA